MSVKLNMRVRKKQYAKPVQRAYFAGGDRPQGRGDRPRSFETGFTRLTGLKYGAGRGVDVVEVPRSDMV